MSRGYVHKETLKGPDGIKLELDKGEIYPDDPGMGTPALVVLANGDTGTFDCVTSEGETVDGQHKLTQEQLDWLETKREYVEKFVGNYPN